MYTFCAYMHVYNWAADLWPPYANSRWARHAAASTGLTVSLRAQAPAASGERPNAEWRCAWQRARELGDEAPARHMCTYM